MPRAPEVSLIVEQVKARLKQIEDQFGHHQRLAGELERRRDVMRDVERVVVSRFSGGHPPAAEPPDRAKRSRAARHATAPARTPRPQQAKILEALNGRGPMTASEVTKVTRVPAATVSTTLTK